MYFKMSFDLRSAPSQKGRIAVVTGANIGLGYETTIGLAKKGAKIIMACRNLQKAEIARQNIEKKVPDADMEIMELDLNSLQSVRDFAKSYSEKYKHLDLLIENAGIMIPHFVKTKDGFESQLGVNYLSHFLLTNLLLPLLKKTKESRIVTLSSLAHEKGVIDFENLNSEQSYSPMGAYRQSKLACMLFAYELQRRLQKAGSSAVALSAHPGVSITNIVQNFPKFALILAAPILPLFTHSPEKAALPILMAALDLNVKGGEYYGPTGFRGMKGKPGKVESRPHSHDKDVANKLWEVSETLTDQKFTV
jgi:NAD(P)-dependent dehydrogenase (short-subunit alcohol dehydrogenase family)